MERLTTRRFATAMMVGLAGTLALTGCGPYGQTEVPTTKEVVDNAQYFELPEVIAANGEPVRCVYYASGTEQTNLSKSWLGLTCDFEGTAIFPGEAPAQG